MIFCFLNSLERGVNMNFGIKWQDLTRTYSAWKSCISGSISEISNSP